jgi:energy-coupling factor transporter transmembrane protein EcfT
LATIGLIGSGIAGVRILGVARDISRVWLLLGLTFLIHWIINSQFMGTKDNNTIFYLSSKQAIPAARFTIRFAIIIATMSTLNRLHDMQRYGKVIGRLFARSPIGRSTLAQFELMATLALRMIPFVQQQYQQLNLTLEARGERTPPRFGKFSKFRRLMYPLVVASLYRADRAALALQARGYNPAIVRTCYRPAAMTVKSALFGVAFCLLSLLTLRF